MASTCVRVDDLEQGNVPAVSAKSGRPCTNPVALALRVDRGALSPGGRRIVAVVPLESGRVRAHRVLTRGAWVALAVVVAGLVAAVATSGPFGLGAAGIGVAAYVALVVIGDRRWIGARATTNAHEIALTRVHRAFADAVDEQYGRSG